jgi:hypothetical protein
MAGIPQSWVQQQRRAKDDAVVKTQITKGVRDENKLTDAVFYDRHPEWRGKSLASGSNALKQEWTRIRDEVVRPVLKAPAAKPMPPRAPGCLAGQGPLLPGQTHCPVQPTPRSPGAPPRPSLGNNITIPQYNDPFPNIKKYRPEEYNNAYAARFAFFTDPFRLDFLHIGTAMANSHLSLASEGVGTLQFYIDKKSMSDLVLDEGLKATIEHSASQVGEMIFGEGSESLLGVLGFSLQMLGLIRDLENERMMGAVGPEADQWREDQKRRFVFLIMAEDIARRRDGSVPDIALSLASEYRRIKPIYNSYLTYLNMEELLRNYDGKVPENARVPDQMNPAELELAGYSGGGTREGRRRTGRWVRHRGKIVLLGV